MKIGTDVEVRSIDGVYRSGRVLDERRVAHGKRQLYIHLLDCDKRMDQWVDAVDVRVPRVAVVPGDRRRLRRRSEEEQEDTVMAVDPPDDEIRNVQVIQFGQYDINTWYYSPYPDEYAEAEKLYICEHCLKYMLKARSLLNHECCIRFPPGTEMYRDASGGLSVYEVDGRTQKLYCQNLCLLSKLFIQHKTLYFDVSPFLFYVLCEVDAHGTHIVGYFSKEKISLQDYNLACIMVLPQHQRKGYGKFLVALSYELTRREEKTGTPERPLSDMGMVTYRSYWLWFILLELQRDKTISIDELSKRTCFNRDDIISTLKPLDMVRFVKGDYVVVTTAKQISAQKARLGSSFNNMRFNANFICNWTPRRRSRK